MKLNVIHAPILPNINHARPKVAVVDMVSQLKAFKKVRLGVLDIIISNFYPGEYIQWPK